MVSEKMLALGSNRSTIRELFEYGLKRKAEIGAENVHFKDSGAYTGEISAEMLVECGVEYVIIGHSERRQYFGETDETVNLKVKKALEKGLIPILCVGESLEERETHLRSKTVPSPSREIDSMLLKSPTVNSE